MDHRRARRAATRSTPQPAVQPPGHKPSAVDRFVVLQQSAGNGVLAQMLAPQRQPTVQRDQPTRADRRDFVETLTRFFDAAGGRYKTSRQVRIVEQAVGLPVPSPDATLEHIAQVLPKWRTAYDNGSRIAQTSIDRDPGLASRLKQSYEYALVALRRLARRAPRVNVLLIAAPGRDDDQFIANATSYARTYFGRPPAHGDTVVVVERIHSLDALLSAVETAQPERMVRRVDVFAHGTIEPSNQLKLAGTWHPAAQFQAALAARATTSQHVQSATRFDDQSVLEFHGCRLGAGEGEQFLRAASQAVGGNRGQEAVGYRQRWFPRRYRLNWRGHEVGQTATDVYGPNPLPRRFTHGNENQRTANAQRFVRDFEDEAVRMFDGVMAGSAELRSFATAAEVRAGEFSRDRKIEIMRAMYDANGAWLLGFLHPAHQVPRVDAVDAVASPDYTFTREREAWDHQTFRIRTGH